MTRYFMSIRRRRTRAAGGPDRRKRADPGADMGQPVKILDLAGDLIALSGISTEDVRIVITGPASGGKAL